MRQCENIFVFIDLTKSIGSDLGGQCPPPPAPPKLRLWLRLNYFLQFSSCGPRRVFSHSNSPSHCALGLYRHTSSSRQIHNIFCWLEILNYSPGGGNGNFHCSSSFLKAASLICEAQFYFAAHEKYILWYISRYLIYIFFFTLWCVIKGIWALFSLLFIFLWNRKPWLDNFMFIITLECSKLWIWMVIYFRDILLIRISRGANNCVQRVFEKNTFHNDNGGAPF